MKSLNDWYMHFGIRPLRFYIAQAWCLVVGHKVNPGDFWDKYGNHDSVSFCERCRKYDV